MQNFRQPLAVLMGERGQQHLWPWLRLFAPVTLEKGVFFLSKAASILALGPFPCNPAYWNS